MTLSEINSIALAFTKWAMGCDRVVCAVNDINLQPSTLDWACFND